MINKVGKNITLEDTRETYPVRQIIKYLDECGIAYKTEYFFDYKGLRRLKYDIAVFKNVEDKHPTLLIEFDGPAHYDPIYWSETRGCRDERGKAHVVLSALQDAYKDYIALSFNIPVLRLSKLQEPMIRDIVLSYICTFAENVLPDTSSREIKMVTMLDKYGWDFPYVERSEPTKKEKDFLDNRRKIKA